MTLRIAEFTFPFHDYDAEADVLYLATTNPPAEALDGDETPEGHVIRYGAGGNVVGMTLIGPARIVEAGEPLVVPVPQPATVDPDDLALALGV